MAKSMIYIETVSDISVRSGYRKVLLKVGDNVWAEADEKGIIDYECLRPYINEKVDIILPDGKTVTCMIVIDDITEPGKVLIS